MKRTHWKEIALQGAAEIGRLGRLLEDARTEIGTLKVSLDFSLEQSGKAARDTARLCDAIRGVLDGGLLGTYARAELQAALVEVAQATATETTEEPK